MSAQQPEVTHSDVGSNPSGAIPRSGRGPPANPRASADYDPQGAHRNRRNNNNTSGNGRGQYNNRAYQGGGSRVGGRNRGDEIEEGERAGFYPPSRVSSAPPELQYSRPTTTTIPHSADSISAESNWSSNIEIGSATPSAANFIPGMSSQSSYPITPSQAMSPSSSQPVSSSYVVSPNSIPFHSPVMEAAAPLQSTILSHNGTLLSPMLPQMRGSPNNNRGMLPVSMQTRGMPVQDNNYIQRGTQNVSYNPSAAHQMHHQVAGVATHYMSNGQPNMHVTSPQNVYAFSGQAPMNVNGSPGVVYNQQGGFPGQLPHGQHNLSGSPVNGMYQQQSPIPSLAIAHSASGIGLGMNVASGSTQVQRQGIKNDMMNQHIGQGRSPSQGSVRPPYYQGQHGQQHIPQSQHMQQISHGNYSSIGQPMISNQVNSSMQAIIDPVYATHSHSSQSPAMNQPDYQSQGTFPGASQLHQSYNQQYSSPSVQPVNFQQSSSQHLQSRGIPSNNSSAAPPAPRRKLNIKDKDGNQTTAEDLKRKEVPHANLDIATIVSSDSSIPGLESVLSENVVSDPLLEKLSASVTSVVLENRIEVSAVASEPVEIDTLLSELSLNTDVSSIDMTLASITSEVKHQLANDETAPEPKENSSVDTKVDIVETAEDSMASTFVSPISTNSPAIIEVSEKQPSVEVAKVVKSSQPLPLEATAAVASTVSTQPKLKDAPSKHSKGGSKHYGDHLSTSVLDAFTTIAAESPPKDPAPALEPAPTSELPSNSEPSAAEISTEQPEDEWENVAPVKPVEPVVAAKRSLRPGGGKQQVKLNSGIAESESKAKKIFTKLDFMGMKPTVLPDRSLCFSSYLNITLQEIDSTGSKVVRYISSRGYAFPGPVQSKVGNKSETLASSGIVSKGGNPASDQSTSGVNDKTWNKQSHSGQVGQNQFQHHGQQQYQNQQHQYHQYQNHQNQSQPNQFAQQNQGPGAGSWARGQQGPPLPTPTQQQLPHSRKGQKFEKPPKKDYDPLEKLTRNTKEILNKITPQTFKKLTGDLCAIDIGNSAMLERLIELVFEKAVQEQNFAHLYSEMCKTLAEHSKFWPFLQIVFNKDSNQYLWVSDLEFEKSLAGPFYSTQECLEAALSSTPSFQVLSAKMQVKELILTQNILVKIFKNADGQREELFISFSPYDSVPETSRSEKAFPSREAAEKDALKKNSFRSKICSKCEQEYFDSLENVNEYSAAVRARERYQEQLSTFNEEERDRALEEIEALENKVKRRKLGNIRFIGELSKQGLLKLHIIHECLTDLLVSNNGDDALIELICKLVTTVGSILESDKNKENITKLNGYFARMQEMAVDTSLNSRIRFTIQGVIELRKNRWQARREEEGPATIEEIHQKAAIEEMLKSQGLQGLPNFVPNTIPQSQALAKSFSVGPTAKASPQDGKRSLRPGGGISRTTSIGPQSQTSSTSSQGLRKVVSESSNPPVPSKQITILQHASSSSAAAGSRSIADKDVSSKIKSLVDEYIESNSSTEAVESFAELPIHSATKNLVILILAKYLSTSKAHIQKALLDLLDLFKAPMQQNNVSDDIIAALSQSEELQTLADFVTDCKSAPEWAGIVIGLLVKNRACQQSAVMSLIDTWKTTSIADDFSGLGEDVISSIYTRLADTVLGSL